MAFRRVTKWILLIKAFNFNVSHQSVSCAKEVLSTCIYIRHSLLFVFHYMKAA